MVREFTIQPLVEHMAMVPTLARWHWEEWENEDPLGAPENWAERLALHIRRDGIPTTFVALSAGQLLGSASLVEHDLPPRQDLTPWLAGVYVHPSWRRHGVGGALARHAVAFAAALAIPRLYLHTSTAEHLYASLGWAVLDHCRYAGQEMTIMAIVPAPAVLPPSA